MDARLFWRSLVVQALALGVVFGILVALPIDKSFFESWGWLTGPLAWILCSFVTAKIVGLPAGLALFAALAGGVAGGLVFLVAGHAPGMVVGLLVFAASCGGYDPDWEPESRGGKRDAARN